MSCIIKDCEKGGYARGLCAMHYKRARVAGELVNFPLIVREKKLKKSRVCSKHPELGEIIGKCKECNKEYQAKWFSQNKELQQARVSKNSQFYKDRNREFVYDYLLEHPCVDCGETDPIVLQFDHLRDKITIIAKLGSGSGSLKKLQEEIVKCEVVCANDHARRTAQRANHFKFRRQFE